MLKRILALSAATALALGPVAGLAQTKVSNLPAGSAVAASDVLPMSQSCSGSPPTATCGATNGVQASALKAFTSASPTLVTPTLGVASATSIGGQAVTSITAGATAQIGTGGTTVCASGYVCDSLGGTVTISVGTGTTSAGTAAAPDYTINFATTRASKPNCVVGPFVVSGGASSQNSILHTETTSTLAVASAGALTASTSYTSSYVCTGK